MPFWNEVAGVIDKFGEGIRQGQDFKYKRIQMEDAKIEAAIRRKQYDKLNQKEQQDKEDRVKAQEIISQLNDLWNEPNNIIRNQDGTFSFANDGIATQSAAMLMNLAQYNDNAARIGASRMASFVPKPQKAMTAAQSAYETQMATQKAKYDFLTQIGHKTPDEATDIVAGLMPKEKPEETLPTPLEYKGFESQMKALGFEPAILKEQVPAPVLNKMLEGYIKEQRSANQSTDAGGGAPFTPQPTNAIVPAPTPQTAPPIAPTQITPLPTTPQAITEADVKQKIVDLMEGKKPFRTYREGRAYFQRAKILHHLDENGYGKIHNNLLKPAYPDTGR